ncbi:hypothetical protein GPX89_01250 [Nocardia sp. ET3-3]|uniref:Restriction endonuclease type IV Mrr domain-containing protein n=1 Tax=Nocardia terrae TaxID=2675851 RepID=A0A7K1UNX6_9NOCA|nr:restriction endonuclease [Nocardia terrae]MVU75869.1 hypothetical protein [Nocardia terrae]
MIIAQPASRTTESNDTPFIARPESVWPRKYKDAGLRRLMGKRIAQANLDTLMAAYLAVSEIRIANHALSELRADREWVQRTVDDATKRRDSTVPFGWECKFTRREMRELLNWLIAEGNREIQLVREVETTVTAQLAQLRTIHDGNQVDTFSLDKDDPALIESIYATWSSVFGLVARFNKAVQQCIARAEEARATEKLRAEFVASGKGVSDRDFQQCDGPEFESIIAELSARDGLTLLRHGGGPRDHGADLIALTPDGRRIVIQCKLRQSKPVSPDVVYQVNGTARPYHKADIPIIVTNSTFSAQAAAFAGQYDIYLIDEYALRRWATWGEDIYRVLGLPRPEGGPNPIADAA